ncbi:MAG: hypothetical protein ACMXX7_00765 [Candidatus Woesearchaeota archaeon]
MKYDIHKNLVNYYKSSFKLDEVVNLHVISLVNPLEFNVEGVRFPSISGFSPNKDIFLDDVSDIANRVGENESHHILGCDGFDISLRSAGSNYNLYISPNKVVDFEKVIVVTHSKGSDLVVPYIFGPSSGFFVRKKNNYLN